MKTIARKTNFLLIFGIPIFLFFILAFITKSNFLNTTPKTLSLLVTLDFLFTIPFIYYLLIRKTKVSPKTVLPLILIGVAIATFILPSENQELLDLFKFFALPIIELSVLILIILKVRKTVNSIKMEGETSDVFNSIKNVTGEMMPSRLATLFATELSVFYYTFFSWKKRPLEENEFSVYKDSGALSLLGGLLLAMNIEMVALHVLIANYNSKISWILTLLSAYTIIQVLGIIKSFKKRPAFIDSNFLQLNYGMLAETTIPISEIQHITLSMKEIKVDKLTRKFTMLNDFVGHNIILDLKEKNTKIGLYGFKSSFKTLAFHIDNPTKFKQHLEQHPHWNPTINLDQD